MIIKEKEMQKEIENEMDRIEDFIVNLLIFFSTPPLAACQTT